MMFRTLISALSLGIFAGCNHVGQTKPATLGSVRESTKAWITDGSPVRFADTEKLQGTPYEGWVDERVAVRFASIAPSEAGYEGEAEWVVEFQQPVAKLAAANRLNGSTLVRLRGMIEGKDLKGLSKPGQADWVPFSIGNNVVTDGATQWMPISALDSIGDRYSLSLQFRSRTGKVIDHRAPWSDLDSPKLGPPSKTVLTIARGFAQLCNEKHPEWRDVRLVNLAAQGRNSAFVNDKARQRKALIGVFAHPQEIIEGHARLGTPVDVIRTRMGRQISSHDSAFAGRVDLKLLDRGTIAGRAVLNLVSTFSAE